jgi:hypothetical protein
MVYNRLEPVFRVSKVTHNVEDLVARATRWKRRSVLTIFSSMRMQLSLPPLLSLLVVALDVLRKPKVLARRDFFL